MRDEVENRLASLGYSLTGNDDILISFSVDKVCNTIRNICNIKEIPEALKSVAVDMTVGEFLKTKNTFAPESIETIDVTNAVKSIQAGDTTVQFDSADTPGQRLTAFIDFLCNYGMSQLLCYRKLRW